MPKTEFLQIRLSPKEKEKIWRAAASEHLEPSTWARRVLLLKLDADASSELTAGGKNAD